MPVFVAAPARNPRGSVEPACMLPPHRDCREYPIGRVSEARFCRAETPARRLPVHRDGARVVNPRADHRECPVRSGDLFTGAGLPTSDFAVGGQRACVPARDRDRPVPPVGRSSRPRAGIRSRIPAQQPVVQRDAANRGPACADGAEPVARTRVCRRVELRILPALQGVVRSDRADDSRSRRHGNVLAVHFLQRRADHLAPARQRVLFGDPARNAVTRAHRLESNAFR